MPDCPKASAAAQTIVMMPAGRLTSESRTRNYRGQNHLFVRVFGQFQVQVATPIAGTIKATFWQALERKERGTKRYGGSGKTRTGSKAANASR